MGNKICEVIVTGIFLNTLDTIEKFNRQIKWYSKIYLHVIDFLIWLHISKKLRKENIRY